MTGNKRLEKGLDADPAPSPGVGAEDASRSGKGTGKGKRLRPPAPPNADPAAAGGDGAMAGAGLGPGSEQAAVRTPASDVRHPLEPGTRVDTRWRDGNYHTCRILEKRANASWEGPADHPYAWEYYVHYRKMNRRMDEWVKPDNFDFNTVELPAEEIAADGTRKKKKVEEHSSDDEEHGDFDAQALREHEELTKVKNIDRIELGCHSMPTWYYSPFPQEFRDVKELFFCEFSLHYFKRRSQMLRHLGKCPLRHPPGDEIYRHSGLAMFEVDGRKEKLYCQNLSYLAKLFLDHKTLYWDVDLFMFYIMCEVDGRGCHIVGYFSKEKSSEEGNNLACILTLPAYQRKGYGKFLIAFSYELSKIEGRIGSPERPLSDLGLVSYRGYWTRVLLAALKELPGPVSIKDLSQLCCIKAEDVITTLQYHGMIQYHKGQHVICAAPALIERCLQKAGSPGCLPDPSKIVWTPYDASKEYQMYSTK